MSYRRIYKTIIVILLLVTAGLYLFSAHGSPSDVSYSIPDNAVRYTESLTFQTWDFIFYSLYLLLFLLLPDYLDFIRKKNSQTSIEASQSAKVFITLYLTTLGLWQLSSIWNAPPAVMFGAIIVSLIALGIQFAVLYQIYKKIKPVWLQLTMQIVTSYLLLIVVGYVEFLLTAGYF